jgi:hypothetical protein
MRCPAAKGTGSLGPADLALSAGQEGRLLLKRARFRRARSLAMVAFEEARCLPKGSLGSTGAENGRIEEPPNEALPRSR